MHRLLYYSGCYLQLEILSISRAVATINTLHFYRCCDLIFTVCTPGGGRVATAPALHLQGGFHMASHANGRSWHRLRNPEDLIFNHAPETVVLTRYDDHQSQSRPRSVPDQQPENRIFGTAQWYRFSRMTIATLQITTCARQPMPCCTAHQVLVFSISRMPAVLMTCGAYSLRASRFATNA